MKDMLVNITNTPSVNADFDGNAIGINTDHTLNPAIYPDLEIILGKATPEFDENRRVRLPYRFPVFSVDYNWKAMLSQLVKDVKDHEIVLPFEVTTFELLYLENPVTVTARQDPETLKIDIHLVTNGPRVERPAPVRSLGETEQRSIGDLVGSTAPLDDFEFLTRRKHIMSTRTFDTPLVISQTQYDELLDDLRYICIALETNIAKQEVVNPPKVSQSTRSNTPTRPSNTYKVLAIRSSTTVSPRAKEDPKYHQRFHVRRGHQRKIGDRKVRVKWCFAGDIALGIVVKDYTLSLLEDVLKHKSPS